MESCSCIYLDTETTSDGPDFCKETYPVAHKEHKCGECGRVILAKEKYESVTGMWEGHFSKHKTCMDCKSVRDAFFCEGWCYTAIWEFVNEHICEMRGEIGSDCLIKLTKPARDKVCDIMEEHWEYPEEESK